MIGLPQGSIARRVFIIGVVTVLVVLSAFALWGGYLGLRKVGVLDNSITVTAHFDDASGLYVGNVVEVLGLAVGSVESIKPKDSYVEVKLKIDKKVKVPANVMAVTISASVLTDRRVELSPPYTDGPVLKDNDIIAQDHTRTPVGFDQVLATVDKLMSSMKGDGKGGGPLGDLVTVGAQVASGHGDQVRTALNELAKALKMNSDGAQTKDQLTAIITSLSSLTKAMADNDQTIRQFGSVVHGTSDILAEEKFGTGSTGRKTNELLQSAADLIEKNRDTIKKALGNTNVILQSASDYQRELKETIDLLPMTLDNLDNAIDPVNGSVRLHPMLDKLLFESQFDKEICNLMGLRQLGCSTGTLADYGPDFGLTYMLDGMARMGQ